MNTRIICTLLLCLSSGPMWASDQPATPSQEVSWAEPPSWPVGMRWPESFLKTWDEKTRDRAEKAKNAHVLVWVPPATDHIRAVFIIPNNSDSKAIGQYQEVRKVLQKQQVAVVYMRYYDWQIYENGDAPEKAEQAFATAFDLIAKETGVAEFRHAPWIVLGKSSAGRVPIRCAWRFPERVIATISYHGEVPPFPMPAWSHAGDYSILHLAINGEVEWDGTWYRHVRPGLLNYNANTKWLCHQVVLPGMGHGDYGDLDGTEFFGKKLVNKQAISCLQVWQYIGRFIDTAMELRVPQGAYATEGPINLLPVDRAKGWLIHPRAPEELLGRKWFALRQNKDHLYQAIPWPDEPSPVFDPQQGLIPLHELVRPAESVPAEERTHYMWIPNQGLVEAWLKLHDYHNQWKRVLPK